MKKRPDSLEDLVVQAEVRNKVLQRVNALMVEMVSANKRCSKAKEEGAQIVAAANTRKEDELEQLNMETTAKHAEVCERANRAINGVKANQGTADKELDKITQKYNEAQQRLLKLLPDTNAMEDEEIKNVRETTQDASVA